MSLIAGIVPRDLEGAIQVADWVTPTAHAPRYWRSAWSSSAIKRTLGATSDWYSSERFPPQHTDAKSMSSTSGKLHSCLHRHGLECSRHGTRSNHSPTPDRAMMDSPMHANPLSWHKVAD